MEALGLLAGELRTISTISSTVIVMRDLSFRSHRFGQPEQRDVNKFWRRGTRRSAGGPIARVVAPQTVAAGPSLLGDVRLSRCCGARFPPT